MQQENNRPTGLICLEGLISNYSEQVEQGNFMLTASDSSQMGIVAVVAAAMGEGAIASGALLQSSHREPAYYVQFSLNGKRCKGWVWVSLFTNGDFVKVAAEDKGTHYELYAIYRPNDGVIALFPHCLRGSKAHYKASLKIFLIALAVYTILCLPLAAYVTSFNLMDTLIATLGTMGIFSIILMLIGFRLSYKWMVFVKLSEKIFKTFGFKNVENIDLPQLTKDSFKKGEVGSAALGLYVFRCRLDINK